MTTTITARTIALFCPGIPKPQGSKRHVGRGIMVESSRELGPWRERLAIAAHNAKRTQDRNGPLFAGPVAIRIDLVLPRPKATPKHSTPPAIKRPDLDKLARAVLDALTAVIIRDDAQVVDLHATKRLAEPGDAPGAGIVVMEIPAAAAREAPR